jgi:hypothetical protein
VFCTCQPCKIGADTDVSALVSDDITIPISNDTQVLAKFSAALDTSHCERVEGCAVSQQLQNMTVVVSDYLQFDRPNGTRYTYQLNDAVGAQSDPQELEPTYLDGVYNFQLSFQQRGTYAVSVYRDEEHLPTSPFFIAVIAKECPADQHADTLGTCVCDDGFVSSGSGCSPLSTIVVAVVVPVLAIIVVGVLLLLRQQRKKADREWQLCKDDIIFDDPPQVLGQGYVLLGHVFR